MTQREAYVWYLERMIGTPYLWGGDDPMAGFDCSGVPVELGLAVGLYPPGFDGRAVDLYQRHKPLAAPGQPGDLVFWGTREKDPTSIEHVEIVWQKVGMVWLSIGASGGNAQTTTLAEAIRRNAFIKPRPIRPGGRFLYFADPFA